MADHESFRAFVNGKEHVVSNLTQLRARIREARRSEFGEFALLQGSLPDHNFFVLFNRRNAWPTYSYRIDRKSFSIRDPDAADDVEMRFRWANGQVDMVPAFQVVTAASAVKAIEHFFRTQELLENIVWHQDF